MAHDTRARLGYKYLIWYLFLNKIELDLLRRASYFDVLQLRSGSMGRTTAAGSSMHRASLKRMCAEGGVLMPLEYVPRIALTRPRC